MSLLVAALVLTTLTEAEARRDPVAYEGDYLVPGDLREVSRFCRKHDGVTGDLIVGKAWLETDLQALSCVQRVGGRLVVKRTEHLISLDGLSLAEQGGVPLRAIRLVDNAALVDVSALSSVESLRTAGLVIQGNAALPELTGLPDLVGGAQLTIADNRSLMSLVAPDGARTGTDLGHVYIANNPHLERISGLARVASAESVGVRAAPRLRELSGLSDLTATGALELMGLPLLETWSMAPRLGSLDRLVVEDVDGLKVLPAMPDLSRAAEVRIVDNDLLETIAGLTVSRGGHPTVDRLVVTDNPRLDVDSVQRVIQRLHLPAGDGAITLEDNAGPPPRIPEVMQHAPAEDELQGAEAPVE